MGITLKIKRLAYKDSQMGDRQNACRVTRRRKYEGAELALFMNENENEDESKDKNETAARAR